MKTTRLFIKKPPGHSPITLPPGSLLVECGGRMILDHRDPAHPYITPGGLATDDVEFTPEEVASMMRPPISTPTP